MPDLGTGSIGGDQELAKAPRRTEVAGTLVRSGTSRFLVLREDELPQGGRARQRLMFDLLALGETVEDRHYQSNKVAVIGRGGKDVDFTFHFYQVSPANGRIYARMECSNAATASAVAAMLRGMVDGTVSGCLRTVNLATRQSIELVPPGTHWRDGDWGVRFTGLHHLWAALSHSAQPFAVRPADRDVVGEIVRHGNTFVMARIAPALVDEALVAALAERGAAHAASAGHPAEPVKVLAYDVRGAPGAGNLACDAACYSEGQRHHSFPGSGAMALAAWLVVRGDLPVPEAGSEAERTVRLHHPSGMMDARVHLSRPGRCWEIAATSFETPVRLVMHGAFAVR